MYKEILLPVDLQDPDSWRKSVADAQDLARAFDSTVHVMTVVPSYQMSIVGSFFPDDFEEKLLATARTQLHEFVKEQLDAALRGQHIVGHGSVYEEVLRVAEEIKADLIVLGASRPMAGQLLPGPNAARIAGHAHCSVIVVRN